MAELLRRKSEYLVAFGSCSHTGGIPGLANFFPREVILQQVYIDAPTTVNPRTHSPGAANGGKHRADAPEFSERVRALNQVVEVDYYVPGCPPLPKIITPLWPRCLAATCQRGRACWRPTMLYVANVRARSPSRRRLRSNNSGRPQEMLIDESQCLLAQGLLCMGPATRAGCEAVCIQGNMPCTGCCGAPGRVRDQGAKAMSAMASLIDTQEEAEIDQTLESLPDPAGTFYRYSLPASLLHAKRGV